MVESIFTPLHNASLTARPVSTVRPTPTKTQTFIDQPKKLTPVSVVQSPLATVKAGGQAKTTPRGSLVDITV